jgi:hypothetical protein
MRDILLIPEVTMIRFWLVTALALAIFLLPVFAPALAQAPTPDVAAMQTQIAGQIYGTLTAAAPSRVTVSPTEVVVPSSTPEFSLQFPERKQYSHPYTINTTYDKFQNVTLVSLEPNVAEFNPTPKSVSAFFLFSGTVLTVPSTVSLTFISKSTDWQFLRNHDLMMLLNGKERLSFPSTQDGRVGKGYVIEFIDIQVTVAEFLRIVSAETIEVQIFNASFALSLAQREALRDLASRMNPDTTLHALSVPSPTLTPTATPTSAPDPECENVPSGQGGVLFINRQVDPITVEIAGHIFSIPVGDHVSIALVPATYPTTVVGYSRTVKTTVYVATGRCVVVSVDQQYQGR